MFARAPAFWFEPPGWPARLLSPPAALYGTVAAWRMARPAAAAPVPVLCIGNFVVGGQGKTPTAIAVAAAANAAGIKVRFLTRGFGGRQKAPRLIHPEEVIGGRIGADEIGDEALLTGRIAPVIVSARRRAALDAGLLADCDLVIMDDGFQSPSLAKTFSLIVVDGATGAGNGRVLPAGPLRAPLAGQMARASQMLVVRDAARDIAGAAGLIAAAETAGVPVAYARLQPIDAGALAGEPLLAFAGIARPEKFYASLEAAGCAIMARRDFADHRPFGESDATALLSQADRLGLTLVTTAKDRARLGASHGSNAGSALAELARRTKVLEVVMVPDEPGLFTGIVGRLCPPFSA